MQSDCKNYFGFLVEEFSGIQAHGSYAQMTAEHFVYLRPWQTVWSRENFENVVFRYVQQAQRMFPLQMQNNF